MSTVVKVNTYTHSVTYVTDNILKSLKDIILISGLSPESFVSDWDTNSRAIGTWLLSGHLQKINLEIYDPATDKLVIKWEIAVSYGWSSDNGTFWTDTDLLRYHINKCGVLPSQLRYDIRLTTSPGRPDVSGWGSVNSRSVDGFVKQSIGSAVEHGGLGASAAYWRKV